MTEDYVDYDRYVDYREMYLKMVRATEAAINILIETQRECEELYTDAVDRRLDDLGLPFHDHDQNNETAE